MVTKRKNTKKVAKKLTPAQKQAKKLEDYKKFAKWPKGTKTKVMHDRVWGGTYTVHKTNLAPLGRPPSDEQLVTKVYDPLHETLTPYGLKQIKAGKSRRELKVRKSAMSLPRGVSKNKFVYQLVKKLDKDGRGASREQVEIGATKVGITAQELEKIFDSLMDSGMMYEPNLRTVKVLEVTATKRFPARGHGPSKVKSKAPATQTPAKSKAKADKPAPAKASGPAQGPRMMHGPKMLHTAQSYDVIPTGARAVFGSWMVEVVQDPHSGSLLANFYDIRGSRPQFVRDYSVNNLLSRRATATAMVVDEDDPARAISSQTVAQIKKWLRSVRTKVGKNKRGYGMAEHLRDQDRYQDEMARQMLAHADIRDVRANLEDRGYSDTRGTWRKTGASTQYRAEMDEARREYWQRDMDSGY